MICPYCNTNNKPGSNFCMGCGSNWSKVLLLSPLRKKVFRNQWAQSKKFPRKVLIQTGLWTHIFHPHLGLCSTHHPSRHTPPNCATTSCATTRRICERPPSQAGFGPGQSAQPGFQQAPPRLPYTRHLQKKEK